VLKVVFRHKIEDFYFPVAFWNPSLPPELSCAELLLKEPQAYQFSQFSMKTSVLVV
jgi:hypothetical protein